MSSRRQRAGVAREGAASASRTPERHRGARAAAKASSSRTTGSIRSGTRSSGTGAANGVPASRCARRDGRARIGTRRAATAGPLSPRVRPRRGVPLLVRRGRIGPARPPVRSAADRRAAARRARPRPVGHGARRGARRTGGAARHRRVRSPWHTSSPARFRLATGHASCSTRMPRATRRSGRPIEAESRADRAAPRGMGAGRRAKPTLRRAAPRAIAARGARAHVHVGLPAYTGRDGLFEGRAVVRLRSRSGRPTG